MRRTVLAGMVLALAACSGGPGGRGPGPGGNIPLQANPSSVVATELAFARTAQEKGQWTAFADYAASDALIFGREGAIEAKPWLKAQSDPAEAVNWKPYSVWSSCDGTLAVATGGFRDPQGQVGKFYTVWQRQRKGDYKWVFDFGIPSDTYPAEPAAIDAHVADCPPHRRGPAGGRRASDAGEDPRISNDGTLSWSYSFDGDPATRRFTVLTSNQGAMKPVIEASATAG